MCITPLRGFCRCVRLRFFRDGIPTGLRTIGMIMKLLCFFSEENNHRSKSTYTIGARLLSYLYLTIRGFCGCFLACFYRDGIPTELSSEFRFEQFNKSPLYREKRTINDIAEFFTQISVRSGVCRMISRSEGSCD